MTIGLNTRLPVNQNLDTLPTSGRISKHTAAAEFLAGNTDPVSPALSPVSPALSEEEIEQQLATATEETQTKIFVNAKGERVLAVKTASGVFYLKIGEEQDLMLSDDKSISNTEMLPKNAAMQQIISQYEQMLSTQ